MGAIPAPSVSSVVTRGAVAVTPHHLATAAALEILASGGNAADAAIAANAVQGMVDPTTCGPGGDLFALVHHPGTAVPEGELGLQMNVTLPLACARPAGNVKSAAKGT